MASKIFKSAASVVFVCAIAIFIVWQLGIFNPPTCCVDKGWVVFQPLDSSKMYNSTNQHFTISFKYVPQQYYDQFKNLRRDNNPIKVSDVKLNEISSLIYGEDEDGRLIVQYGSVNCSSITVDGRSVSETQASVAADDSFRVDGFCAGAGRKRGDTYEIDAWITYNSVIGGIVTPHMEGGRIRGTVE